MTLLLWLQETGSACAGLGAPCKEAADPSASSHTAHASSDMWQGLVGSPVQAQSKQGKLRRAPNVKVMEESQDQHEAMNFKYVLYSEKLKP